jgi:phosphomannomutase
MLDASIIERTRDWIQKDPNQETAEYVRALIDRATSSQGDGGEHEHLSSGASVDDGAVGEASRRELAALFPPDGRRIGFGTAGLRSAMVPGPTGMNDLTVVQAAQGLARFCLANCNEPTSPAKRVSAVIGYDHRANAALNLSSLQFALLTTLVFLEAGLDCVLLDGYVATPLVPFCMQQTQSRVGIMITASHNPKRDAGYKVYLRHPEEMGGYACQIRSPTDQEIAACIVDNLDPWIEYSPRLQRQRDEHGDPCAGLSQPERTKELISKYFQAVQSSGLVTGQARLCTNSPPKFCYTAMHGVGHSFAVRMFEAFGLSPFASVPAQQSPDCNFPTIPFPNPEEAGALDLAKAYAESHGCSIVLANDPDADRLAVAEYRDSKWTVFTGDQIGTLLGHWLWRQFDNKRAATPDLASGPIAMLASTVSSQMLAEIARVEGFRFEDTLTGFKWIGARAAQLRATGHRSVFCYEEAIGFCCGDVIYDKDGLSAMGVMCELALCVYNQGSTLCEHLQSLYDEYGEFVCSNGYYLVDDVSVVPPMLQAASAKIFGDNGGSALGSVGPYKVSRIRYLGEPGRDSSTSDGAPTLPTSNSSPMLTLWFENGCVAQFRGSGTEPKFKYYIEMKGQPGVSRANVERDLLAMSAAILPELLHPERNGLRKPKAELHGRG